MSACDKHKAAPVKGYHACPGCEVEALRAEVERLKEATRRASERDSTPVAYAVVSPKGGVHKLSVTRESADRKAAKWREEWPNNGCEVRPLVFAAAAPDTKASP